MFEHKNLDGERNRIVPATDTFISGDVLEMRESIKKDDDPKATSRMQYGVVVDRLVERCLPPETIGDKWSYDNSDLPWWGTVNNPPHAGIIAEFNSHNGGKHRKPLEVDHNVVAFAALGEEVTFKNGEYTVIRKKDNKEIKAKTLLETRRAYYSEE